MSLLKLYRRESEISGVPLLVMAVISGVAQSALLGIITTAADTASHHTLNFRYLCLFAIAFAVMFISKRYALQQANIMVERMLKKVRVRIADKIRNSELLFLEHLGKGELYTRLAHDTNLISESAVVIINASQSALVVVFCLLFVAILSPLAFLLTVGFLSLTIASYVYHNSVTTRELIATRAKEGRFFEMLNQLLDGFKELKMNRKKSDEHFGIFTILADTTESLKINVGIRFITDIMFSQVSFFSLLGIIVFLLPWFGRIEGEQLIRLAAAILFIIGPTNMVVGSIQVFARANIAVSQLYDLESQLDAISQAPLVEESSPASPIPSFENIHLKNIQFSYL